MISPVLFFFFPFNSSSEISFSEETELKPRAITSPLAFKMFTVSFSANSPFAWRIPTARRDAPSSVMAFCAPTSMVSSPFGSRAKAIQSFRADSGLW